MTKTISEKLKKTLDDLERATTPITIMKAGITMINPTVSGFHQTMPNKKPKQVS